MIKVSLRHNIIIGLCLTSYFYFSLFIDNWGCLIFNITHIKCPFCGITRACKFLIFGDFIESLKFNCMLLPIFLTLLFIVTNNYHSNIAKLYLRVIAFSLLIFTIIRNLYCFEHF